MHASAGTCRWCWLRLNAAASSAGWRVLVIGRLRYALAEALAECSGCWGMGVCFCLGGGPQWDVGFSDKRISLQDKECAAPLCIARRTPSAWLNFFFLPDSGLSDGRALVPHCRVHSFFRHLACLAFLHLFFFFSTWSGMHNALHSIHVCTAHHN